MFTPSTKSEKSEKSEIPENSKKVGNLSSKEIEIKLREFKIQPTAQRIAICNYVLSEAKHPTVEEVKAWADQNFPKISLATVYNTMNILAQAGLLKSIKFPHLDKIIFDNNTEEHFHFLDEATGQIVDLSSSQVKLMLNLDEGMEVKNLDVIIRGRLTDKFFANPKVVMPLAPREVVG